MNCFFLYNYSSRLEKDHFLGSPGDYLYLLIFNWLCCAVVGLFASLPVINFNHWFNKVLKQEEFYLFSFWWIRWFCLCFTSGVSSTKKSLSAFGSEQGSRRCICLGKLRRYFMHTETLYFLSFLTGCSSVSICWCPMEVCLQLLAFSLAIFTFSWSLRIHKSWAVQIFLKLQASSRDTIQMSDHRECLA